ncbi:hypothetical protein [Lactococcus garvieae]
MKIKSWAEKKLKNQIKLVKTIMLLQSFFGTVFLLFVLSGLSANLITMSELPLSVSISGALMLIGAFAVLIFGGYTLVLLALIIISDPKAFFFEKTEKIKQKLKPTGGKA